MNPTKRIILNTFVQYFRSILNIVLSLFSTRYIVEALGKSDYGIYLLVGGVIAMLGFITNALVTTTQRYISYHYGENDILMVKKIFANTLFVHIVVSLLLTIILFSLRDLFVFELLNIPTGREIIAQKIYGITVCILITTILIAPYKAVFIAHENMAFISIVEICDGLLKLGIALIVLYLEADKLLMYAILMLVVQCFNFVSLFSYAWNKFDEARTLFSRKYIDKKCILQLVGFAGWSTYGMASVVFRSQGIQWMLNVTYSTVMNAAYGIGLQVYGSVSFVATSILNAMNPQIMKAEGEGNREKMLNLAEKESKYSTMLLMLVLVPILLEMPSILSFWLSEVPEYTDLFCRFILLGFIIDQCTYGINVAIQAIGQIKLYTLIMYSPKLLVLIPIYLLLDNGYSPFIVMCVYLLSELLVSIARIPYIKYACGLKIWHFFKSVIFPLLPLLFLELFVGIASMALFEMKYRFLLTILLSVSLGIIVIWFLLFSRNERGYILNIVENVINIKNKKI